LKGLKIGENTINNLLDILLALL